MIPSKKNKTLIQLALVSLTMVGLLYVIIDKASRLSFTHDESYTYLHYVHQGFMDIISYKTPYTNNHILNTVLIKYFEELFGRSEFIYRLPNILGFILYSYYGFRFLQAQVPKLVFPSYLLLVLNPYLLDFFGLARGYGLSISFLMMSIYYMCGYLKEQKLKQLILFNVGAFLAIMSNFSLLNYYVAALITYNGIVYMNYKFNQSNNQASYPFLKMNRVNFISIVLTGMVLFEPLRRISKQKLLDFGGENGFIQDTICTSIDDLLYEMHLPDLYYNFIKYSVLGVTLFATVFILIKIVKKDALFLKTNSTLVFVNSTLMAIVIITLAQHFILGNEFYIHRFALFLFPIFVLNFIGILSLIYNYGFYRLSYVMVYAMSALLLFNLYVNHNRTYFKDWKYDQCDKIVMEKLILEHEKNPSKKIKLGIFWMFEPTTNFYRYIWDLNWLQQTHRNGIQKNDDYLYIPISDKARDSLINKPIIYSNPEADALFLKNN